MPTPAAHWEPSMPRGWKAEPKNIFRRRRLSAKPVTVAALPDVTTSANCTTKG